MSLQSSLPPIEAHLLLPAGDLCSEWQLWSYLQVAVLSSELQLPPIEAHHPHSELLLIEARHLPEAPDLLLPIEAHHRQSAWLLIEAHQSTHRPAEDLSVGWFDQVLAVLNQVVVLQLVLNQVAILQLVLNQVVVLQLVLDQVAILQLVLNQVAVL